MPVWIFIAVILNYEMITFMRIFTTKKYFTVMINEKSALAQAENFPDVWDHVVIYFSKAFIEPLSYDS